MAGDKHLCPALSASPPPSVPSIPYPLPLTIHRIYASCHGPITAGNVLRLRGRTSIQQGASEVPCRPVPAASFAGLVAAGDARGAF